VVAAAGHRGGEMKFPEAKAMKRTLLALLALASFAAPAQTQPGPAAGSRITEGYARMVARDADFLGWPMVNIYNKRLGFGQVPHAGLMNGVLPGAPLNHSAMLSDYVEPSERFVACPNQDVVYGSAVLGLEKSTVSRCRISASASGSTR